MYMYKRHAARLFVLVFLLFSLISEATGLICYSCDITVDHNRGNCTKVMKQCQTFQDRCTTYVSYGALESDTRRHTHISKGCDTWKGCEYRQYVVNEFCDRKRYKDWSCVDCCSGDLCNYYVKTSGSNRANQSSTSRARLTHAMILPVISLVLRFLAQSPYHE